MVTEFFVQDGVATLRLNRPQVKNALNRDMRGQIIAALTNLPAEARCVVLTGTGDAFCSGQDLHEFGPATNVQAVLRDEYEPMLAAIADCPVPVVAAVNGVAAGAGANLALVADMVVAADSAQFIQAFSRIGLIPDAGGSWFIPRLVGHARAMGMMLLADAIPAAKAAEWGLIWQSFPDAEFADGVAAIAARLAAGPRQALRRTRRLVAASWDNDLPAQLALEAELQAEAAAHPDFAEGVRAVLEKRAPRFS